jgi:preprotein translocase subunit SecA
MLQVIKKIFGDKKDHDIKALQPVVEEINQEYEKIKNLSDDELREKTQEFKSRITEDAKDISAEIERIQETLRSDEDYDSLALHDELEERDEEWNERVEETLDEILPEAFAVVKATCERLVGKSWTVMGSKVEWNMVPYDVQLMGGVVLHQGKIAEMATGEGKTLVATLPLYLNALAGKGAHLVTVNDYLAQRDAEWMGEVFRFHGLTVGVILSKMNPQERKKEYACDVTYGTNNEFGFDYLRDNMAIDAENQVQRGHHFAIVDEVDSVLIDEARTPLIISGAVDVDDQQFSKMMPSVKRLVQLQNNFVAGLIQEAKKILDSDAAHDREARKEAGVLLLRAHRGAPKSKQLLKAFSDPEYKKLQQDTELEYLREKGKYMHIIDDELYFVIDEKNHQIDLTEKGREELANYSGGDADFFVLTDIGEEVSKFENDPSLSEDEKRERKDKLYQEYSVKSDRIHTLHQLLKAFSLFQLDDDYVITEDGKIAIVDEFTGRVLPGRRYSDGLHQAIEAKENVKVERDTQTVATITLQNYFRMYHKLAGMTGTAETEEGEFFEIYKLEVVVVPTNKPIARADNEDQVYRTKREKYNAVADKIDEVRNEGRPILVGTTSVEVSETISRMLKRRGTPHNVLNAKQHQREAEVVAHAGEAGAVTIATNMAGRGTDIKLGAGVKDRGGLFILGTERHESRRIDRQLRGRSGRQGDPGESIFYLSLEDDLMRLFGSERIAGVMERLGVEEGEVISHKMVTKSVERAQKRVEENNFAIRKRLLEYDDVMNQQREVIYDRRSRALKGERLKGEVFDLLEEFVEELVERFYEAAEIDALLEEVRLRLLTDVKMTPEEFQTLGKDGVADKIVEAAKEFYNRKEEHIGSELMARIERFSALSTIDNKWKEHLREMDDLKEGIGLRAYGQKDPLIEYKAEAYRMFVELLGQIRNDTVSFCFKFVPVSPEEEMERRRRSRSGMVETKQTAANIGMRAGGRAASQGPPRKQQTVVRDQPKVGRNDPCPCGSGKKYKHCHGKN